MRVRIHEAGHDRAAGGVDHLGLRRERDRALGIVRGTDKDDAAFESRDRGVRQRRNLALRRAAPRTGSRARRDEISVVDQEIGEHLSRLDQFREGLLAIDAGDPDPLRARAFAGDDRDVAFGNAKGFGDERDELVVCGAVDRRRREPDKESAVAQPGESAAARASNDSKLQIPK